MIAKFVTALVVTSFLALGVASAQLPPVEAPKPPVESPMPLRRPQMHFGTGAVVEVFCSVVVPDCVTLLGAVRRIQLQFESEGTPAQIVVFHVGSRDTSVARDPFGDQLSERKQRDYAELMRAKRVGVPQLFVNGVKTPILLDGSSIIASVVHSLKEPSTRKVQLEIERSSEADAFRVHYKVGGMPLVGKNPLQYLHVVQIQKQALHKLRLPGKPEPVALAFTNVARSLESVRLEGNAEDSVDLIVPEGVLPSNIAVIAYVQDARTRKILGFARTDLTSAEREQ